VRRTDPELYEKVSQNIRRWTEDWIGYARAKLETGPPERIASAQRKVERVDDVMKRHFEERSWPYRPLRAVFLPQRLLFDERSYGKTLGMFMPFYPDVLFSTVDPSQPLEFILVHENLHYNAKNRAYGPQLLEGVTDSVARELVSTYALLEADELRHVRRLKTYVHEREMIDVLCSRIVAKTGQSGEQALEVLLEAYLTDDDSAVIEALGERAWSEIVELSWTANWRKRDILEILDGSADD
jgi:hypothetical protein